MDQLRVSAQQLGVTAYDEVEVLGGGDYVERVRESLRGYATRVLAPYAECGGIGVMMGLAKRAVDAGIPMDRLGEGTTQEMDQVIEEKSVARPARGPGRPSETSNPLFIRRAFELHLAGGLAQGDALAKAAEEFGLHLPPSYAKYPGVHFHRWRSQGHASEVDLR